MFPVGDDPRPERIAGAARFRVHCPLAAGRRRARRVSGAASTKRWPRPISIPTGSPASRSAPSTAALIAGNPPERRVERLREFWETVTKPPLRALPLSGRRSTSRTISAALLNQSRAFGALLFGAPDFFTPAHSAADAAAGERPGALSFYDTAPLKATLERLVDFDRINARQMRFSVGAVNVRTGNFVYFDNATAHDRAGACDGERLAAAGLSRHRDRRRVLLGRRPRLQHAAAMGARQPAAPGHARLPGRPVERARRAAARP